MSVSPMRFKADFLSRPLPLANRLSLRMFLSPDFSLKDLMPARLPSDSGRRSRSPGSLRGNQAALAFLGLAASLLAGCDSPTTPGAFSNTRAYAPLSQRMRLFLSEAGTSPSAPILIRSYKKEAELEIWKMNGSGRYVHLKTYPMCRWSGQLGPKVREGDRQVPEGFYSITPAQMHPNSHYYLSFDVGYPNTFDRAWGRSGGSIMVHGVCSSAGCFSMTDEQIEEIYALVRESFAGGQRAIQMQSYPFHMTAQNLAKYRLDPNIAFWRQLKEGSDHFEITRQEVLVGVCERHYVFNALPATGSFDPTGPCPPLRRNPEEENAVEARVKHDEEKVIDYAAHGVKPVHTVYADGGQHPSFASRRGEVSRPEALAQAPVDYDVEESKAFLKADAKTKKGKAAPVLAAHAEAPAQDMASAQVEPATGPGARSGAPTGAVVGNGQVAPAQATGQETNQASAAQATQATSNSFFSFGGLFGGKSAEPATPANAAQPVVAATAGAPVGSTTQSALPQSATSQAAVSQAAAGSSANAAKVVPPMGRPQPHAGPQSAAAPQRQTLSVTPDVTASIKSAPSTKALPAKKPDEGKPAAPRDGGTTQKSVLLAPAEGTASQGGLQPAAATLAVADH